MGMTIEITRASHARVAVITSDEAEIRLAPGDLPARTQVLIEGEHRIVLRAGLELGQVSARGCDLRIEEGVKLMGLAARSLVAEGDLYPVFGMQVAGDATIAGWLNGERHAPCRIGGNLAAEGIDIDGTLIVAGDVDAGRIEVRRLQVGGEINCPNTHVLHPEDGPEPECAGPAP